MNDRRLSHIGAETFKWTSGSFGIISNITEGASFVMDIPVFNHGDFQLRG
jgi:hypothetical protein